MTLEMPSDPFGTPSGLFTLLDPPQEIPALDDAYPPSGPSLNPDFIMDFEEDLDFGFEVLGGEVAKSSREDEPVRVVEVKSSTPLARPVSRRAPSMPTILEEDEQDEEEEGDVTITPSEAQRAFLPPDKFARPRPEPQLVGVAVPSQDVGFDSLATPRPHGKFRLAFRSSVITSITDFR